MYLCIFRSFILARKMIDNFNVKIKITGEKCLSLFQLTTFITTEYNSDLLLQVLAYSIPWLSYMLRYNILCLNIKKVGAFVISNGFFLGESNHDE